MKQIALIGEYDPSRETQLATSQSIEHSSRFLNVDVASRWIGTDCLSSHDLADFDGMWIAPGSVFRDQKQLFEAIRYARTQGTPCFGTCGGFQQMVLEYARNERGLAEAQSEEYEPGGSCLVIRRLHCSLRGLEMNVQFRAESRVSRAYGTIEAKERYYCSLGCDPAYRQLFDSGDVQVTGRDEDGEIRVIESRSHPFFVATLFVPQVASRPESPHPLVNAFVQSL